MSLALLAGRRNRQMQKQVFPLRKRNTVDPWRSFLTYNSVEWTLKTLMRQQSFRLDHLSHWVVVIATDAATGVFYNLKIFGGRCECKPRRRSVEP